MTKTLNVKRRSIKSPPRPRRTVHRLSIFPLSNSVPHSVTVPHGRFRHGNNRAELRTQFRTVPSFPQHLRGFQDLLRCLHSVLIGLEIEFFYKAKAIKKPHAVASATAQGFVFLYLFCVRIGGYAPQWRSSVTLSEFVIFATNGSVRGYLSLIRTRL